MAALICVDLVLNGCGNSKPSVPVSESVLIEPGVGVGKVRAGMTADEINRAVGPPLRKAEYEGTVFLDYPNSGFVITLDSQDVVKQILCGSRTPNDPHVEAFKGHTKEGLGMGSSRAAVIKTFGQPIGVKDARGVEFLNYGIRGLMFGLTDGKVHFVAVYLQAGK